MRHQDHFTEERRGTVFGLPEGLAEKADPELIMADEEHLATVAEALAERIGTLDDRLGALRRSPGGKGRSASDRDLEIHRLTAQLRLLRRFGLDLCLGRIVPDDGGEVRYIGWLGLAAEDGRQLLIDWRAPAAAPYFAATLADPMGLASRRRYRWTRGKITDYWDEVFGFDGFDGRAALDDDSAFIASLGSSRSPRMRDVLGTIQADQDKIIRADSHGALVIDGGPGTGKTVVALHRAAYLLYADRRVSDQRGGLLFVGPHRPYLAYVADVLPNLGEEGVQICTVRDLVPEGAAAPAEPDPEVARLKATAAMVDAIEPAVALYEEPPRQRLLVETPWSDLWLSAGDWAEAFGAAGPSTPHNEAREEIWEALVSILYDKLDAPDDPDRQEDSPAEVSEEEFRAALQRNELLVTTFTRAWTLIGAADLVSDLWSVPAYLRRCAPWLAPDEVQRLQRERPQAWTESDLPLLDAARHRLGDPEAGRRARQRERAIAAERERMDRVVEELITAEDDSASSLPMLRGEDLRQALVDPEVLPTVAPDRLAGPYAHIIVDEAQELTDAEWRMLVRRCPSRSFTIVGDRAQARRGFTESWAERLRRAGLDTVNQATLTINYRTPREVMAEAEPVIRAVLPDVRVPTSIRTAGVPVRHGRTGELDSILDDWLAEHADGIACVIGHPADPGRPRVRSLSPAEAKGLEFDLVVLVDPASFGTGIAGAVDRYVSMTRATQQLVVLTS
ncbi:RNA polymerase recycling motor ATPase HelR [Microlunatus sp. GCM10028923]|uniref:RNA polymerase recycling motor ATPase HelR n=1 Tax=Microlunatus sp. GCM10028923 TaxID=3273400 RepID=UPI00361CC767